MVAMDHEAHGSVTSSHDEAHRAVTMTVPDPFPDSATVRAVLVRSEWGHYRATLTLPGGRTQTITSDELNGARAQVIDATRSYLAAEVRHPGRLHVEDPEGRWLLGVPHDGGDLVPLPDLPAAPPLTPRPVAPTPGVPSRPAPPGRRPPRTARSSVRRPPPSSSRRVVAVAALAVAVLLVAGIVDLTHSTRSPRRAPAAAPSGSRPASTPVTAAPVTTAPSIPAPTPVASPPPSPRTGVEASEAHAPSLVAAPSSILAHARRGRPPRPCGRARADLRFSAYASPILAAR